MIHLYVLSGFLGAGKTSVLRHLLDALPATGQGRDLVVLVNEFGALGLDGKVLRRPGLDMYELASGCICCTLTDDLSKTLLRIADERRPARMVIEASGVADPRNVRQVLELPRVKERIRLARVVTILDTRMWARRAAFGALFFSQMEQADLIVLNKKDLLGPEAFARADAEVRERFPASLVVAAEHGGLDPETFWSGGQRMQQPVPPPILRPMGAIERENGESAFSTFSFTSARPIHRSRLTAFFADAPAGLLRAKGQVAFAGESAYLDFVDGRLDFSPPLPDLPGTQLTFIGKDLPLEELRQALENMLA